MYKENGLNQHKMPNVKERNSDLPYKEVSVSATKGNKDASKLPCIAGLFFIQVSRPKAVLLIAKSESEPANFV